MGKRGKKAATVVGEVPGGGGAASRRKGPPEPGTFPTSKGPGTKRKRGRPKKHSGPGRKPGTRYTPEERRRLLEAYARSGMKLLQFSQTVGVSHRDVIPLTNNPSSFSVAVRG